MTISLSDTGKRYNREWIFRNCSKQFHSGNHYAITGPNGSGKSTLLQSIAGAIHLSEGKLAYTHNEKPVEEENIQQYLSIATPYLELVEEMTALEHFRFQQQFKPFRQGIDVKAVLAQLRLEKAAEKQIRYYSSGMKQRLKLALAFFADTPVLLLDEPSTNLDADGFEVYRQLLETETAGRLVIISSNEPREYEFCTDIISILDYKPKGKI